MPFQVHESVGIHFILHLSKNPNEREQNVRQVNEQQLFHPGWHQKGFVYKCNTEIWLFRLFAVNRFASDLTEIFRNSVNSSYLFTYLYHENGSHLIGKQMTKYLNLARWIHQIVEVDFTILEKPGKNV